MKEQHCWVSGAQTADEGDMLMNDGAARLYDAHEGRIEDLGTIEAGSLNRSTSSNRGLIWARRRPLSKIAFERDALRHGRTLQHMGEAIPPAARQSHSKPLGAFTRLSRRRSLL
jgi:hypothetical protein